MYLSFFCRIRLKEPTVSREKIDTSCEDVDINVMINVAQEQGRPVFTEVYDRVVESPNLGWSKRNMAKHLAPPVTHHHISVPRHEKKDPLHLSPVKKRVKESTPPSMC